MRFKKHDGREKSEQTDISGKIQLMCNETDAERTPMIESKLGSK